MNEINILIADDEERIRKILSDFLNNQGYSIIEATDGSEAINKFSEYSSKIQLVILDVLMPKADGWQVLTEIRKLSEVPVMMLTAKGEEADQLIGFRLGADDYVHKPFSPSILVARVQSLLKRSGAIKAEKKTLGSILIDEMSHKVYVDDNLIELTPKEYDLLMYFAENNNMALSRERILNSVWNYDYFGDLRTVDTHVKQLRAKLKDKGDYIQTVRGIGYRFEVKT
jgi:two-component system, OmpR family, response regulator ResD